MKFISLQLSEISPNTTRSPSNSNRLRAILDNFTSCTDISSDKKDIRPDKLSPRRIRGTEMVDIGPTLSPPQPMVGDHHAVNSVPLAQNTKGRRKRKNNIKNCDKANNNNRDEQRHVYVFLLEQC